MNLTEGLQELDLEDLVLPLLSIDEFESKIDNDAIVVGFFVQDFEPAKDLERFIQKSAITLLDTEVSTAPDDDGYFMLFLELTREPASIKRILEVVETLEGLTGLPSNSWKFTSYGHNGVFPLEQEQLGVLVNFQQPEDIPIDDVDDTDDADHAEELDEFFRPSLLDNYRLDESTLVLERNGRVIQLDIVGFGSVVLQEKHGLVGRPLNLSRDARMAEVKVESMLGENWFVSTVDGTMVIGHSNSPNVLMAKLK